MTSVATARSPIILTIVVPSILAAGFLGLRRCGRPNCPMPGEHFLKAAPFRWPAFIFWIGIGLTR